MADCIKPPEKVSNTYSGAMFKSPKNGQTTNKATAQKEFDQKKDAEYDRIYSHELKHKRAGATGSIVIEKDSNGVPTGGHVDVQMPTSVNKAKPKETLEMARIAYESATAPGSDMSDQDKNVASNASNMMTQAQTTVDGNNNMGNMCQKNPKSPQLGNKLDFSA